MIFRAGESYWRQAVRPSEYAKGLLFGTLILTGAVFVFYNSLKAMILAVVFIPVWMRFWDKEMQKIRREQFEKDFARSLQIMSAALEAGQSFENAMRETLRTLVREGGGQTMIGREYALMCRQLSVNMPAEQIWGEFAARCGIREVKEMAMVIGAGKRTGGNLIRVMRRSVEQTAGKMEVIREIRAVLASRRLELRLMLVMPFAILLYMRLVFGRMISLLYGNAAGVIVMTLCLGLYAAAAVLGHRIVQTAG